MPADVGARLARGERIAEPVALVVAHADDETIGLGSRLRLFDRLTLVHLTDGAPLDLADARRAGFGARADYAAARARELDAALRAVDARPVRRLAYGLADQTLVARLPELADRLAHDLAGAAAVFTHAYEGGHPDHDAAALAVAAACARRGAPAPRRWEFAGYFGIDGVLATHRFHPDPGAPEHGVTLSAQDRARKAAAYAAYATQGDILANFGLEAERWRRAPAYDFTRPPPPGETHYDRYGWAMTGARWRAVAAG